MISWRRAAGSAAAPYSWRYSTSMAPSIDMAEICACGHATASSAWCERPPAMA